MTRLGLISSPEYVEVMFESSAYNSESSGQLKDRVLQLQKELIEYIAGIPEADQPDKTTEWIMPMFMDESNDGNIKREELIERYKNLIPNWIGDYSQGFADAFNWLCQTFKENTTKPTPPQQKQKP